MGSVTDINSLFKSFKDDREKQEFCEQQFAISVSLQKQIKLLEEENKHLKELLSSSVPLINPVITLLVTPEEALIDGQIDILEERGRNRKELTLEEVKKMDLLLKNKNILKQNAGIIPVNKLNKSGLSKKELLQLAVLKKDDENVGD